MLISPDSLEWQILFIATILILSTKLFMIIYLGRFIIRRKRETGYFSFDFTFGFFIFVISLFISRVFLIYFDFYLTKFDPNTFYLMPNIIFWKLGQLVVGLGFVAALYPTETKTLHLRTKGFISLVVLILHFFVFFIPVNSAEDFDFVSTLVVPLFAVDIIIPIVYYIISAKSPGFRKGPLVFATGILTYSAGVIIIGEVVASPVRDLFGVEGLITIIFFYLLLKAVGIVMGTYGIIRMEYREKSKRLRGHTEKRFPKVTRIQERTKKSLINVLSISAPEKVTEEVVHFFREQNICIVCKGKIRHWNFICECTALYCQKCARALEDLENACWACNLPINKSKPSKPFKEVKIVIEAEKARKIHKK